MLDPLLALVLSFTILAAMLYKRVSIGVALISSAVVLSLLSMELGNVASVFVETTRDSVTISLVLVTFGIMLLSLLYKETAALRSLGKSFSGLLRRPKLVVSALPAIIGLLAVPGGALMSAPLVETEAEKLGLKEEKKTYVNVWFRHIIFPIYPMSQVLILAASLTGTSIGAIIVSQIPVVATMISAGYVIGLKRSTVPSDSAQETSLKQNLSVFLVYFSPILIMILAVIVFKINVGIAAFMGIALLLLITRPSRRVLTTAVSTPGIYKVALAAYGAMLLRSVTMASGVSETLGQAIAAWNLSEIVLLATLPAILAFLVGSPSGGIAVSVPILVGTLKFTPSSASLLFISTYFGYLAAPTHLCLVLTADYFKCPLSKIYRLLVPSLAISFTVALLVYYLF